jgi:Sulfatase.
MVKNTGNADCELPESFNHVPLIIYAPFISPHEYDGFAGQVDIAPTLLALLRIPYTQNNLGVDLLSYQRPAAFYTADKTIAARDKNNLFVYNASTQTSYSYELKRWNTASSS